MTTGVDSTTRADWTNITTTGGDSKTGAATNIRVANSVGRNAPISTTTTITTCASCEGGGDVVGVVTPLVGGVAQAFHDDQVVELRAQLEVQEVEGKEENKEQVEEEKRPKEVRSWMTMEMFMTRLRC